jgi:hypothetical protein
MPTEVLRTDTFETWRQKSNTISADIGTTSALDSNLINKTITLTETGNYVAGQVVTGSLSGVTATVVSINGTILTVKNVSAGTFIDRSVQKSYMSVVNGSGSYTPGATITGSISGATAKVFSFNSVDSTLVIYNITSAFQSSPPENIVQGGTTRQLIGVILNNSSDSGENIVQASPSVSKQLKSFNRDVVASLNEHQSDIGIVENLVTSSKILVNAVNELKDDSITFNGNKTFSGNTLFSGTVGISGNTTLSGLLTLGSTSNIAVNTNKFTVAASSGNTLIAGTLGVTGQTTIGALSATSGTFSGTLGVTGQSTIGVLSATNGSFSGTLSASGIGSFSTGLQGTTVLANGFALRAAADSTNAAALIQFTNNAATVEWSRLTATNGLITVSTALTSTGNFVVGSNKFTVNASTGDTAVAGTLSVNAITLTGSPPSGVNSITASNAVFSGAVSTGNTSVNGTLSSTGNFTAGLGAALPFTYNASTGQVIVKGGLKIEGLTEIGSTTYTPAWSGITGKPSPVITVAITGDVVGTALPITLTELAAGTYTATVGTTARANLPLTSPSLTTPLIGGAGANFSGSSSGQLNLKATAAAGSGVVITLPATTGTVVTTGDSQTVTNAMLTGSIANSKLINSSVTVSAGTGLGGGGAVSLGGSVTLTNAGVTSAAGGTGILVNTSTGAITISHSSTSNLSGAQGGNGIRSITVDSFGHVTAVTTATYITDVTSALGYTPYNGSTNPNGYITSSALSGYATETYVTTRGYITSAALAGYATETYVTTRGYATESYVTTRGYITSAALSGYATESYVTSRGYITGITSANVTTALSYTPYNGATNPNGYITSAGSCAFATSSGSTSGNAGSATVLQTARSINGVSFNGSASITVPAAAGTLTGNTLASGVTASSLTSVGTLNGLVVTGTITATGDITAGTSDDRLKTRFGNIPDALNKVLQLNGFYYTHNKTAQQLGLVNKGQRVGVSAQEVLKVLPEVIRDAPVDESYMTVDYAKMVPLLIEAIKGLNAKVESLEAQLKK